MVNVYQSVLTVVQARISSTRLPGKALLCILSKPMIIRQLERMRSSSYAENPVIATTTSVQDDLLADVLRNEGYEVFRGSDADVLDRYYQASLKYKPDHIVRITADCPLIDSAVIDKVVVKHLESGGDYTSNTLFPTYPDGLDVEVVSSSALEKSWMLAKMASEREHVTLFIKNNREMFECFNVAFDNDLSHMRWTVDESADLEFVRFVYSSLYSLGREFLMSDIAKLCIENPEKTHINKNIDRDEGLEKSLKHDYVVPSRL